jgi:hypothetical protein
MNAPSLLAGTVPPKAEKDKGGGIFPSPLSPVRGKGGGGREGVEE